MDPLTLSIVGGVAVAAITGGAKGLVELVRRHKRKEMLESEKAVDAKPALTTSTETSTVLTPILTVVHNLGPRSDLIGRAQQLQNLRQVLYRQKQSILIFGPPGIGKSSIAVEVAYGFTRPRVLEEKVFDVVLFFTARLKPMNLTDILDEIGRWTGNIYVMKLTESTEKSTEVKKILSATPILLVLDNLEAVEDLQLLEFLDTVPYPSRILATSRRIHNEISSLRHIELPAISDRSSDELLRRELSGFVIAGSAQAVSYLTTLESFTNGNPLAIKWTAGQLRIRPLKSVLEALEEGQDDLFRTMFESGWSRLSSDARTTLAALTLFRAPPTSSTVQAVAGVPFDQRERPLSELRTARLIEASSDAAGEESRLSLHPLTQSFAGAKLALAEHSDHEQLEAAFVDYYQEHVAKHGGRDWDDPRPFELIDTERENFLHAARLAHENGQWESVIQLVDGLRNYLLIFGYWNQRLELCQLGVLAADQLGSETLRAKFLRHVGWTLVLQGGLEEAQRSLEIARQLAASNDDLKTEADATGDLAEIARLRGDLPLARTLRSQSLRISRERGNERDIYVEQALLAQIDLQEGRVAEAQIGFTAALKAAERLRWHRAMAYCLHWLADVARLQGEYALARSYISQSRAYVERFHDRARMALLMKSEALLYFAEGDHDRARDLASHAAVNLQMLGLPYERRELEPLLIGRTETPPLIMPPTRFTDSREDDRHG